MVVFSLMFWYFNDVFSTYVHTGIVQLHFVPKIVFLLDNKNLENMAVDKMQLLKEC